MYSPYLVYYQTSVIADVVIAMYLFFKFRTELPQSSQVKWNGQDFVPVDLDNRDQLEEKE